jgi:ribosome-binding ATPase YchF (GTP1/OBG family)
MSSLKIGLLGLPNVGKSTLFNALTNASVLAANYPFATIEPNTGIVPVPDERLDVLARMYKTDKVVPATVEFVDVAGLVEGASKGEGLGNKFLANIRECDAICHVVRAFDSADIQRADGADYTAGILDMAKQDIDIINTELALADIATIENHLPKLTKEAKANPKLAPTIDYLTSLQNQLLTGSRPTTSNDYARQLQLFTEKPIIYLFNVDENGLTDKELQTKLRSLVTNSSADAEDVSLEAVISDGEIMKRSLPVTTGKASVSRAEHPSQAARPIQTVFICAELESQLRELSPIEAQELLTDYGVLESGLNLLAKAAYATLGLQSYLTAGVKEVRAWTIKQGATAPQAAGVIHTDFEKGFIAAQVVSYPDLVAAGSESAARSQGKLRTEGKTYVMQPDDVVEFRFNV